MKNQNGNRKLKFLIGLEIVFMMLLILSDWSQLFYSLRIIVFDNLVYKARGARERLATPSRPSTYRRTRWSAWLLRWQ